MGLLPTSAMAAVGAVNGVPPATTFTKNVTTVGFAGREWYVIDTGADGVTNPGAGSITLLAKDSFGTTAFRIGQATEPEDTTNWIQFGAIWYQGVFASPSDYNDSTLMHKMVEASGSLPANEAAFITPRSFGANADGIGGAAVSNQKLWPLSMAELISMGFIEIGDVFWMLSNIGDVNVYAGPGIATAYPVNNSAISILPALNLNLSNVFMTTEANGANSNPQRLWVAALLPHKRRPEN